MDQSFQEEDNSSYKQLPPEIKGVKSDLENSLDNIEHSLNLLLRIENIFIDKDNQINELKTELNNLKAAPASFKEEPGYQTLTEIIKKAEKYDCICSAPNSIVEDDENTEIVKRIKWANFLFEILNNPEKLLETNGTEKCKLTDIVRKGLLFDKIISNPGLVTTEKELADTALSQIIKAFQKFENYKNYWNNLQSSLLNTLRQLFKNDEVYNMRALLFYAAQLYSISCIMNEIHSGNTPAESQHQANVSVFNNATAPSQNELGLPASETSLNDFEFQYENAPNEVEMVNFLKKYKPLPFIFINSFYSNRILSDADS